MPYPRRQRSTWTRIKSSKEKETGNPQKIIFFDSILKVLLRLFFILI